MSVRDSHYWIFSNKSEGAYDKNIWDQATIMKTRMYTIKESEPNRAHVKPGDVVHMRIYNQYYIGKFTVGGNWKPLPGSKQRWNETVGQFPMEGIVMWSRPLPQSLIIRDLSNQNYRRRIVSITSDDALMIETAQRVYARLGFGNADDNIIILEQGLEEAIKPNLKKMGLKLAEKQIQQQFSMGPGVGRSDLICVNEQGDLVVLELKRGMTSDETIGQVLRYVGWVQENIAQAGQKVHGWIIAGDYDEHLRLAALAANIRLVLVRLG
jgi:hypothetical protein